MCSEWTFAAIVALEPCPKILYIKRFRMPFQNWQEALWRIYKDGVFVSPSTNVLFNFYRDEVRGLDVIGAARIRQQNLRNYLRSFPVKPRILIVGEAPGPKGARFSGVPFTSERLYAERALPFAGRKSSANETLYAEPTATIFWNTMASRFPDFLIWNTLPWHPHRPGEPLSIRAPKTSEVHAQLGLMEEVLRIVDPEQILAVGRIAQGALTRLNLKFIPIRHPSHGGATEFARGINNTFDELPEEI